MKKYKQPGIRKIELDSEQAILNVCSITFTSVEKALYFTAGGKCKVAGGGPIYSYSCTVSVKGQNTNRAVGTTVKETDAMPS